MRKVLIAIAAVAAIGVGAFLYLWSNLDSIVKTAIEDVGSRVTGVPVHVAAVKIALKEGNGTVTGLTVGNPAGFTSPTAFSLGEISVTIDPASITGNPIVIKDVRVAAPQVTYELGRGGSNIAVIQRNVEAFAGGGGAKAEPAPAKAGASAKGAPAKKLVIDQLLLTDGKVTLATPLPGGAATAALGEIRLAGLGRASGGATAAEIAGQVVQALSAASVKAASSIGVGKLLGNAVQGAGAQGGLDQIKSLLGK